MKLRTFFYPGLSARRCRMTPRTAASLLPFVVATCGLAEEPPTKPTPIPTSSAPVAAPESPARSLAGDATEPSPAEILKKADQACRGLKAVRYSVKSENPSAPPHQRGRLEGSAFVRGWKNDQPERFRYEVRTYPGGGDVPTDVVVGFDGASYYAIDTKTKKVTVGPDRNALGVFGILARFFPVHEFVQPSAFAELVQSAKLEYRGPIKVGDDECDSVFVGYASGLEEAVWYFSKKDYLPRRVDRKVRSQDGATKDHQFVITGLRIDPKAEDEAFSLKVPEGYTRVDVPRP